MLRLLSSAAQGNFDFESFWLLSEAAIRGENVYVVADRYNYGPVWYELLGLLRRIAPIAPDPILDLRIKLAGLLTMVDIGIALLLVRRVGRQAATIFFLNPVSILISGHHAQFDNFAILIGLAGVQLLETDKGDGLTPRAATAAALLGLSLAVKHILFLLPLWLLFRRGSVARRLALAGIPCLVFVACFLPYAGDGWDGIRSNVLGYRSSSNAPLWTLIWDQLGTGSVPTLLFLAGMVTLGVLMRRQPLWEAGLSYTIGVVALSSAVANQYLAIPAAAAAARFNPLFLLYLLLGGLYLVGDPDGLGIGLVGRFLAPPGSAAGIGYSPIVVVLLAGGVMAWLRARASNTDRSGTGASR